MANTGTVPTTTTTELTTTQQNSTPFEFESITVSPEQSEIIAKRIADANKAKPEQLQDITPIYWEAALGETRTMVFLGFKKVMKKNDDGTKTPDFAAVFHDSNREIVMAQLVIKDAMRSASQGDTFVITCTQAVKGMVKKFTILKAN
jgi:hypothetical protein